MFRRHPLPLVNQRGDDAVLDCLQHFAALGAQASRSALGICSAAGAGLAWHRRVRQLQRRLLQPDPANKLGAALHMMLTPFPPCNDWAFASRCFLQVTLVTLDQAFRQRAVELGLHCLEPQRLLAAVRGALGAVPAASASADIGSSAANGSSSGLSSSRSIESGDASSDSGAAASSDSATTTSSSSAGGTSGSATRSDSGTSGRSSSGSGSATESCTEDEAAFGCIGRVVHCAPGAAAAGTPRLAKLLGPQLAAAETCVSGAQGCNEPPATRLAQQLLLAVAQLLWGALGESPAVDGGQGSAGVAAAAAAGLHSAQRMLHAAQGMASAAGCLRAGPALQVPARLQCDGLGPSTGAPLPSQEGRQEASSAPQLQGPQSARPGQGLADAGLLQPWEGRREAAPAQQLPGWYSRWEGCEASAVLQLAGMLGSLTLKTAAEPSHRGT